MAYADACVGYMLVNHARNLLHVRNSVVYEEHLSVAAELEVYGLFYGCSVETLNFCVYWVAVGWRCLYHRKVARSHYRELKCAGNGGGGHCQCVDVHLHLAQFLLYGNAEFLLLVDDEQSQVFEFYVFARESVGADNNVYLALFELFQYAFALFCRACAAQVFYRAGELFQSLLEVKIVLIGEHGGGHEHCHLLAVGGGLEGCAYGNLGLSESHVAADETIHRTSALHVLLHFVCGFQLVGSVLVDEACFEFVLQVGVGREGESLFAESLGVELYEVAGNVLDFLFGALFHALPCSRSQLVHSGWVALLAFVFRYFVQVVYRHEYHVVVFVKKLYCLLHGISAGNAHESSEFSHSVVDVHNIVAGAEFAQLFQCQCCFSASCAVAAQTVVVESAE